MLLKYQYRHFFFKKTVDRPWNKGQKILKNKEAEFHLFFPLDPRILSCAVMQIC